jgi:hypothetical protein
LTTAAESKPAEVKQNGAAPREKRERPLHLRLNSALRWLHTYLSMFSLMAVLLFSVTGITLNHASSISGKPVVTQREAQLPQPLMGLIAGQDSQVRVPGPIRDWLESEFGVDIGNASVEWSEEELYVSAPGPGRDAWMSVDRESGAAKFEGTQRGWVAYFNDLHKGRNTGIVWWIFIDVVAAACLFFSITGLILLQIQARQRKGTWPLVGGGVALVAGIMIFFAH